MWVVAFDFEEPGLRLGTQPRLTKGGHKGGGAKKRQLPPPLRQAILIFIV